MNVLFLDIDGVVNNLIWDNKREFRYSYPPNAVNNFQACQWISKFCKKFNFSIVVSSSWRSIGLEKCKKCLYEGGIWKEIPIIDVTPTLYFPNNTRTTRGSEITNWLEHTKYCVKEPINYLIFDDDNDMDSQINHLVKTDTLIGFTFKDFIKAQQLYEELYREQQI